MKIPVKEAINSGAWLQCHSKKYDKHFDFRLKLLSFDKINLSHVDDVNEIKEFHSAQGYLWLMRLQIVNLNKMEVASGYITGSILIVDQDDFEFSEFDDFHLTLKSNFAKKSGLKNFGGLFFRPKIKYTGAIAFFLPKDEEIEYYISVLDGDIQEV
jgi:hypothetical protein